MGAITKRHQGIRHLRKDITHIQLSMDYDRECKEKVIEYVNQLPEHMGFNFELLMSKKDLKEMLKTPAHISLANDVIIAVLRVLNQYRRKHPVLDYCQSCNLEVCQCTKRYLINDELNKGNDEAHEDIR